MQDYVNDWEVLVITSTAIYNEVKVRDETGAKRVEGQSSSGVQLR
jgi:hypothetical protein